MMVHVNALTLALVICALYVELLSCRETGRHTRLRNIETRYLYIHAFGMVVCGHYLFVYPRFEFKLVLCILKTPLSTKKALCILVFVLTSRSEQLFDRKVDFAAAPDVFPPDRFNAGVMVVAPSQEVLEDMLSKVSELPSYDGGDTGKRPRSSTTLVCYSTIILVCSSPPVFSHKTRRPKPWNSTRDEKHG